MIIRAEQLFCCPVCGKQFYETDDNVLMPFCSARCKQIDAARWLNERYSLPIEREENINAEMIIESGAEE
jgi:endogenous inhibitor of DNA gyrase (YacG/DUF329 family)